MEWIAYYLSKLFRGAGELENSSYTYEPILRKKARKWFGISLLAAMGAGFVAVLIALDAFAAALASVGCFFGLLFTTWCLQALLGDDEDTAGMSFSRAVLYYGVPCLVLLFVAAALHSFT